MIKVELMGSPRWTAKTTVPARDWNSGEEYRRTVIDALVEALQGKGVDDSRLDYATLSVASEITDSVVVKLVPTP